MNIFSPLIRRFARYRGIVHVDRWEHNRRYPLPFFISLSRSAFSLMNPAASRWS